MSIHSISNDKAKFNEPRAFRFLTNALHYTAGAGLMSQTDVDFVLQILDARYFSGYFDGLADGRYGSSAGRAAHAYVKDSAK